MKIQMCYDDVCIYTRIDIGDGNNNHGNITMIRYNEVIRKRNMICILLFRSTIRT